MVINWETLQEMTKEMFASRGLVWPNPQDASCFLISESVEILDLILREKNYVRNHDKPLDKMWKEVGQTFMMLCVTCMELGHDPFIDFMKLYQEYTNASTDNSERNKN